MNEKQINDKCIFLYPQTIVLLDIIISISREKNGKYYVSVVYDIINIKNNDFIPRSIIGIDLGIKKLLTLSDGVTYDNNKYIEKYEKGIKRLQRELSWKVRRNNNYYKCKKKLVILYSKLENARNYYLHNITKKISDASFYEIIRQLEYKCKYKDKLFYQIDTYYPSSQECNVCGNIDKKYKNLSEREYKCSKCHNKIDCDLMYEGIKLYMKEVII